MTCKLCGGLGVVYGNQLSGTVYPVCGGTGVTPADNTGTPAEKTLLDEFAMAAMSGTCANSEYEKLRQALDGIVSEEKQTSALVSVCYDYAAAMMKERNRRDEMGNVKEATEQ